MNLKVVELSTASIKHDPVRFLREMADCIEGGSLPVPERAVISLGFEGGSYTLWGFGQRGAGDHSTLALLAISQQILAAKMAGVAIDE